MLPLIAILINVCILIFVISLLSRLVSAVEKIANIMEGRPRKSVESHDKEWQ
jgi:hypothetical protein